MKRTATSPAKESIGTRLAEKTRAVANHLSDEERERLLHRGMQMIYGSQNGEGRPPSR